MTHSPRLWFATFGGMAAYAVHILGNYWLVPVACGWGTRLPLYLLTLVLLAIAAAATSVAVGIWRHDGARRRPAGAASDERVQFMARFGALLGFLAVGLILFAGAATFFFDPCQGTV